ncbi:MAG: penicillin-binding transpeptidase domain-containing protein, partial [Thermodesulfobacteriota bacterium]|nr:penicillin-binding transpeptidase domain-containing protein [Thermodesulfobacteriota bacterium]
MNSLLRSAVTNGTARSLKKLGITFPVAGKTGTTDDYKDAWFVGYTPDILALVWVGFDNGDPLYTTGAKAALPIWANLMNSIPQYISKDWFALPPGVVMKTICSESGQIAVKHRCPAPMQEYFLKEQCPQKRCTVHSIKVFEKLKKWMKELAQ